MAEQRRASRAGIWGWMLFDWAQQPFFTLLITFVFAPYFASAVAPNAAEGQELWGYATGFGGLSIAHAVARPGRNRRRDRGDASRGSSPSR